MGGVSFRLTSVMAYCVGSVGWVSDQPHVKLGNGAEFQMRLTMVAAIERAHWRVVQWHSSLGRTNEEAIGLSLTTSIDAIERSVRDDRPDMRPASAPDGTVTIVFTDIESSTVLMECA